ncbi:MAG: hypothetical protein R3F35_12280 [Myxococcota bacterium]
MFSVSVVSRPGVGPFLFASCAWLAGFATVASAGDLTSAHYRLRTLGPASVGAVRIGGPVATETASGIAFGRADALGPMGSAVTLRSIWPGVWPIAAGTLPHLDLDGDARPGFLDEDDDGDGLLDVFETGTGVYASPTNTGTSPVDADSDDDGWSDGYEVANGFDPNDPLSPEPPQAVVPMLGWIARGALGLGLLAMGGGGLAARRRRDPRVQGSGIQS